MNIDQTFPLIAPYLSIVHRIPGRLRFKLDTSLFEQPEIRQIWQDESKGLRPLEAIEQLRQALASIAGVTGVNINALARSCTITFDPKRLPEESWQDLLSGKTLPSRFTS